MTITAVHVASYATPDEAVSDWEALKEWPGSDALFDAVLVETRDGSVCALHRFWTVGPARGGVASGVVGLLLPSALVCGALAGGVGDRMITILGRAFDRAEIARLGTMFDLAPVAVVAVERVAPAGAGGRDICPTAAQWRRSLAFATADTCIRIADLSVALRADALD